MKRPLPAGTARSTPKVPSARNPPAGADLKPRTKANPKARRGPIRADANDQSRLHRPVRLGQFHRRIGPLACLQRNPVARIKHVAMIGARLGAIVLINGAIHGLIKEDLAGQYSLIL